MPRYYVDNAYNRRIGRVGLPVGSFVVSKNSSFGSSGKTYVDNAYNRSLGRVGMPHGSMVVSRDGSVSYNSTGVDKTYVDNPYNRSLGRVGMPHGSMVVSRESSAKTATTKTKQSPAGLSDPTQDSYVNPRRNTDDTSDDNVNSSSGIHAYNRSFGMSHESMAVSRRSGARTTTRKPEQSHSTLSHPAQDPTALRRHNTDDETVNSPSVDPNLISSGSNVVSESESTDVQSSHPYPRENQGVTSNLQKLLECPICTNTLNGTSVTPCGHRFCLHCIMTSIEHKPECPLCRKRLSERALIRDTQFDEVIAKINERSEEQDSAHQEQQQTPASVPVSSISEILLSVLPIRDQEMRERTDNLIGMKDSEIQRLNQQIQTHDSTVQQHQDDVIRLETELEREREKTAQLEDSVSRKRQRKEALKNDIQRLQAELVTSKTVALKAHQDQTAAQSALLIKVQELQSAKDSIENKDKEINDLKKELSDSQEAIGSIKDDLENKKTANGELLEKFHAESDKNKMLDAELVMTKQEIARCRLQIEQLILYERMCKRKDEELQQIRGETLPTKDSMIADLQSQVQALLEEMAVLKQTTVPMSEHTAKLNSELHESIQQLQSYYEEEYDSKVQTLERTNESLQSQLRNLENETMHQTQIQDQLQTATKTYKTLIAENTGLHERVKKNESDINRLRQELQISGQRNQELQRNYTMLQNRFGAISRLN